MKKNALKSAIFRINDFSDIGLAVLLVAIISIMILPMPTIIVDGLIALNLAISLSMLMLSMYIPNALSFSVFPSMLLFTTLFRLALNVTTTRLILLEANAGSIIDTFGNFVVGGNFIVGGVIFLILTIVQFLVIAKGSERVAEVGARFTLDAMPGKQMSIDADMRAGNIDMEEARKRRAMVTQESQLFGAMDGAMKFVKGDAIAGLIVAAINILGGVGIGVMQLGMSADEALQTYAILTIGDGLVSQIPAMLISITAGIVVTRVSKDDAGPLGGEIGGQFLAQPKALLIAGVLVLLFALIPGFPKPQFILLGLIITTIGFTLFKGSKILPSKTDEDNFAEVSQATTEKDAKAPPLTEKDAETFSITVPLLIDLADSIRSEIKPSVLNEEIIKVRRALYYDMGVPFPGINLRFISSLPMNSYSILLHEVPMSQGWLFKDKILIREQAETLTMMGFDFEEGKRFIPEIPALWAEASIAPKLEKAGITFLTPPQVLTFHLSFLLKRQAANFIGMQETRYLLTQMEGRFAELVREVQRVMATQKIADIFQRLVGEQISIRNLRQILEALIEWGQKEKDSVMLTEYVRTSLKRQISYQYGSGSNVLPAYLLDPDVEDAIRSAIRQTSSGSFLALAPEISQQILSGIRNEVGELSGTPPRPVLLTSMDIRRYLRKMIEIEFFELPVLSYQELTQEISVQPLGRISI